MSDLKYYIESEEVSVDVYAKHITDKMVAALEQIQLEADEVTDLCEATDKELPEDRGYVKGLMRAVDILCGEK
jgi:hypothetical protein